MAWSQRVNQLEGKTSSPSRRLPSLAVLPSLHHEAATDVYQLSIIRELATNAWPSPLLSEHRHPTTQAGLFQKCTPSCDEYLPMHMTLHRRPGLRLLSSRFLSSTPHHADSEPRARARTGTSPIPPPPPRARRRGSPTPTPSRQSPRGGQRQTGQTARVPRRSARRERAQRVRPQVAARQPRLAVEGAGGSQPRRSQRHPTHQHHRCPPPRGRVPSRWCLPCLPWRHRRPPLLAPRLAQPRPARHPAVPRAPATGSRSSCTQSGPRYR